MRVVIDRCAKLDLNLSYPPNDNPFEEKHLRMPGDHAHAENNV